jgi:dienelactone hydrolase
VGADWEAKRQNYSPNTAGKAVALHSMHEEPASAPLVQSSHEWPQARERIFRDWLALVGSAEPNTAVPPLDAQMAERIDCGAFTRTKVSFQVQSDDRMPAWLLVPKNLAPGEKRAAIICLYGTTSGAGKDTTVGLSGAAPGSMPERNRAFALDMVEAGFVALAPDLLRDGERLPPGGQPYDTTSFYQKFPDWSCVGKDCRDIQRAVDYLQSLPFVDPGRIGITGHSYGGHTAIFAAGFEPRIKVVFSSGPVSDFVQHGGHWAVPKGARSSQSLPNLRPYLLEHRAPPVTFAHITALIAPRPLWVNQAVGEWRPQEEFNAAAVSGLYRTLGAGDRIRYVWSAGDHDFPPPARAAAVEWFRRWLR